MENIQPNHQKARTVVYMNILFYWCIFTAVVALVGVVLGIVLFVLSDKIFLFDENLLANNEHNNTLYAIGLVFLTFIVLSFVLGVIVFLFVVKFKLRTILARRGEHISILMLAFLILLSFVTPFTGLIILVFYVVILFRMVRAIHLRNIYRQEKAKIEEEQKMKTDSWEHHW